MTKILNILLLGTILAHDFEIMAFCTDAYLRYIHSLDRALHDMECELEEHTHSLELMGIDYSKGASSGVSSDSKIPDGVARLFEIRERLQTEYARCSSDLAQARALCRCDESRYALWMSRVEGMPYANIARKMGYSKRTIRRMVDRGKVSLYYMMPEEWRRYSIPNALPE